MHLEILLILAQLQFAALPLLNMRFLRSETDALHVTKRVIGISAFAMLVAMFTIQKHVLGASLCILNLLLRIVEVQHLMWRRRDTCT